MAKGRDYTQWLGGRDSPDVLFVLEEQLGLKLEPARAPREFIVIDAVERPTPN